MRIHVRIGYQNEDIFTSVPFIETQEIPSKSFQLHVGDILHGIGDILTSELYGEPTITIYIDEEIDKFESEVQYLEKDGENV